MRIRPSGDAGLLLELDDLDEVLTRYAGLRASPPPGVVDLVPAGRTVLVVLDPAVTTPAAVEQWVRTTPPRPGRSADGGQIEIPVVYDGPDLAEVADLLGASERELVARHTGATWTVAFGGFAPGFGYLVADDSWSVPRRDTPRPRVPAGSVALAGEFSGIYPRESPGGWQLIGRTEVTVFDPEREPPALLAPGTRVRFVAVDAR